MTANELGGFLRARRAAIKPDDVGLVGGARRRVPGLRREEVALLAGISVDYYLRIEQGREPHPSAQVLDALAAALLLDDEARLHAFQVSGLAPRPSAVTTVERASSELLALIEHWADSPALVLGRAYDVLASNGLGRALFPHLQVGDNLLTSVFLDPSARTFYADWREVAADTVAGFRLLHGARPHDPRVHAVLAAATAQSAEFATLWRDHDARGKRSTVKSVAHPHVGPVAVRMQAFDVRAAPGQQLVVYHAADPASRDGLRLLGSLSADLEDDGRHRDRLP